jgi:uncharacterized protein YndB with AHSA1/START domain
MAQVAQVTLVERKSEREAVVRRTFDFPAQAVFDAWAKQDHFKQWWTPKSSGMTLLSCDMDVRVGGAYRLQFEHPAFDQPMTVFGTYTEVVPASRLVWTNEESGAVSVTTLTFEEHHGKTNLMMHENHPTKAALDESFGGTEACMPEQFEQLDAYLGRA